jgi:hypothetical protein
VSLPQFSVVRLTTDRFLAEGVGVGAVGVVLDVYDEAYDVEFSRPEDGTTIALLIVKPADIEPAPDAARRSEHASV